MATILPRRSFLFLQGPHGPFFSSLAKALSAAGAETTRISLNAGDRLFLSGFDRHVVFTGPPDNWLTWLRWQVEAISATDIVLYGRTRPVHAAALGLSNEIGLTAHVLDEGHIRPWWITYERATTGAAILSRLSISEMEKALQQAREPGAVPANWGDTREHVFWSGIYHAAVLAGALLTPPFPSHRSPSRLGELGVALRYFLALPFSSLRRALETRRLARSAAPYHLMLLQLAHDTNFATANPERSITGLVERVVDAFSAAAPSHHRLVFKAHPFEDGRSPLRKTIRRAARRAGNAERVHFLAGAPLAPLLDNAATCITVNSTAAHQALWRGLPTLALGPAPYARPGITSDQTLEGFFARPEAPQRRDYLALRAFLLATSQIGGGFYAASARRRLLRSLVDRMMDPCDPYDLGQPADAARQQFALLPGGR